MTHTNNFYYNFNLPSPLKWFWDFYKGTLVNRELTYPTWGKGKSFSKVHFLGGYVSSQEGIFKGFLSVISPPHPWLLLLWKCVSGLPLVGWARPLEQRSNCLENSVPMELAFFFCVISKDIQKYFDTSEKKKNTRTHNRNEVFLPGGWVRILRKLPPTVWQPLTPISWVDFRGCFLYGSQLCCWHIVDHCRLRFFTTGRCNTDKNPATSWCW